MATWCYNGPRRRLRSPGRAGLYSLRAPAIGLSQLRLPRLLGDGVSRVLRPLTTGRRTGSLPRTAEPGPSPRGARAPGWPSSQAHLKARRAIGQWHNEVGHPLLDHAASETQNGLCPTAVQRLLRVGRAQLLQDLGAQGAAGAEAL